MIVTDTVSLDRSTPTGRFAVEERAGSADRRFSEQVLRMQDEERRRIARELHDGVGQYAAAIEMSLVAALDPSLDIPEHVRDLLRDCLGSVRACSLEVRTMSQLLHPPLLEVIGLAAAVGDYVKGFSKRSGVGVELDVPETLPRMDGSVETAALRIVQESLMNVYRHSGSDRAVVRVHSLAGHLSVEVQDFGRGIPPGVLGGREDGNAQPGVGLQGMRCRLEQLGGFLELRSDDDGTLVRAILPSTTRLEALEPNET